MAAEDFFARWAKKRQESEAPADMPATTEPSAGGQGVTQTPQAPQSSQDGQDRQQIRKDEQPLPTMEDVARLTRDSDYSPFMAKGVDEAVKRSAMKKLFSDPHFNVMDGLDVYIEDFTKFEPITPAMLASLEHAKELLSPVAGKQASLMRLLDLPEQEGRPASAAEDGTAEARHKQNSQQNSQQDPQEQHLQERVHVDAPRQIADAGETEPPDRDETTYAKEQDAAAHKVDDN